MTDDNLSRRTMLAVSGLTLAGLAGCSGSPVSGSTDADDHEDDHDEGGHTEEDGHDEKTDSHDETTESHDDGGHEEEQTEADNHDDGGSHGHEEEIGDPVEEAEAAMITTEEGEHFDPHVVRVTEGGTVTWPNESGSHATAAYAPDNDKPQLIPDGAESWDSGLLTEEGATFEHTFETEGVYHYYCAPHESVGMIGSVIVGEPEAHGQPALEDPPEDMPDGVREKLMDLNERCNEALGHGH